MIPTQGLRDTTLTTLRRYSELGPDSMDRQVTRVAVITTSGAFEGDFSYHRGDRISDAIRTSEGYILLTDVRIQLTIDVPLTATNAPFLLINSAHIDVIVPLDQSEQERARETD